jgi:signal transduction histidine kinase
LLENLLLVLSNACKYSDSGEIDVTFEMIEASHTNLDDLLQLLPMAAKPVVGVKNEMVTMGSVKLVSSNVGPDALAARVYSHSHQSRSASPAKRLSADASIPVSPSGAQAPGSPLSRSARSGRRNPRVLQALGDISEEDVQTVREKADASFQEAAARGEWSILVAVQDRGTGIAPEDRQELFSPRRQAQRRTGGTGENS